MNRLGLEDTILNCQKELGYWQGLSTNCISCDYYKGGTCTLYQSAIPEEFAQTGCDKWEFDDVPF